MAITFDIQESSILQGVYIIKPSAFCDIRGAIWSAYTTEIKKLLPQGLDFVLDKFTLSKHNVLRGIHGDHKSFKLVSCVYGEVQQVVVDCRKDSKTYLKWESFMLNAENRVMILMPPKFGNAYYVKSSPDALYYYKWAYSGDYVDSKEQFTYAWNDEKIGIQWECNDPILSMRDMLEKGK